MIFSKNNKKETTNFLNELFNGVFEIDTNNNFIYLNDKHLKILKLNKTQNKQTKTKTNFEKEKKIKKTTNFFEKISKKNISNQTHNLKEVNENVFFIKVHTKNTKNGKITGHLKIIENTAEKIKKRNEELEKFHTLAVGRELRMRELKNQIKKLEHQLKELKKETI